MITEEHIKESISRKFVELLAANSGFNTSCHTFDYGMDLSLTEVGVRNSENSTRFFNTGKQIDIQIKATTQASITQKDTYLIFELPAKNYNDLVDRSKSKTPLLLVVFILPEDRTEWVNVSEDCLTIKKCAYWFLPSADDQLTENKSTKSICISTNNVFTNDTISQLFEEYA